MNRDQVKGKAKDIAGKVQRKTGQALGNPNMEARGMARQVAGKTQKALGDAAEKLRKG